VAEDLVRRALHPYPVDLLVATKGGLTRQGPHRWTPVGHPALLRQSVEMSLRRLVVERIDLYYLHRVDPVVPLAEQLGVLADMAAEGKIAHIGLSKVGMAVLAEARRLVPVAAVQNCLHFRDRSSLDVLDHCEREGIAFIPYEPLAVGGLLRDAGTARAAAEHGVTPTQLCLAWLLSLGRTVLPIRGTSSLAHLVENAGARDVVLDPGTLRALTEAVA